MTNATPRPVRTLLYTVYFIYFFCGMTLCFEGSFLPEFKERFGLIDQQQMYTMFAKNIPFLLAVAIGLLINFIGFKHCLTVAMLCYSAGTFLLVPGLKSGQYGLVLLAFFIIGTGFNFQLVAGNPLLSALGPTNGSSSRLNLGNALGAIAQIIAPLILSFIIPVTAVSVEAKLPYMSGLFIGIAVLLLVIALGTLGAKNVDLAGSFRSEASADRSGSRAGSVWSHPKVVLGFITILLVLGAEAGVFGLYRNYLEDPQVAGFTSHQSQRMFTVYFAVFALGRLVGAALQKRYRPAATLAGAALAALGLLPVIIFAHGILAVVAITALGLFVSIFFPTLYSLAIEGLGDLTAQASGWLTMGFLGCAFLPVLQGRLADRFGLPGSFGLCFIPYLGVLIYALKGSQLTRQP